MTYRVLLVGEGKTELGGWAGLPNFRAPKPLPGVLVALLERVASGNWEVCQALEWKHLVRYRANEPALGKDELNVRALWLRAVENNCDLIVFSRDRDRAEGRAESVAKGQTQLDHECAKRGVRVIGGMAHECIEAWVLAVAEERRTEALSSQRAKQRLADRGIDDVGAMVSAVAAGDITRVSPDAGSLLHWLAQAKDVLLGAVAPVVP